MKFFDELKRRDIYRVAAGYAVVAWVLLQIVNNVAPGLNLPNWAVSLVIVLLAVGFPIALVFAWIRELPPADAAASSVTTTKFDWVLMAAVMLVIGLISYQQMTPGNRAPAPAIVRPNSIAVLPLANLGGNPENAAFVEAIHGELLTQLSKISALKVISRTSVLEYRDTPKNMREIGRELGAATILEGDIQRAGTAVRINVQLIDAATDEHIWANIYNRQVTAENILAIQSEIATAIATALQATLTPRDVSRLSEVATQNTRAYDFYLSAREYHRDPDRRARLPLAIQQYQSAVAEDPGFAVAFAHLSEAHSFMHWFGFDRTEARLALARAAADKALALQPNLPEAHLAMANYHYRASRDYEAALRELTIAAPGMPNEAELYILRATIYRRTGRWDEALADIKRFLELDPRNALRLVDMVANTYSALRNYAEAERLLDRALEIAPDAALAHSSKAELSLFRSGDVGPLLAFADNSAINDPDQAFSGWVAAVFKRETDLALRYLNSLDVEAIEPKPKSLLYGVTYLLAGQGERAKPYFEAAKAQLEPALASNPEDPQTLLAYAESLAGLGESDNAIRSADKAMAQMSPANDALLGRQLQLEAIRGIFLIVKDHDRVIRELDDYLGARGGDWSIEGIVPDPRFDAIRTDPRLAGLVEKYKRR